MIYKNKTFLKFLFHCINYEVVPEEDFTGKACTSNLVFFNKKVRCGHKMTQFGVVCMLRKYSPYFFVTSS